LLLVVVGLPGFHDPVGHKFMPRAAQKVRLHGRFESVVVDIRLDGQYRRARSLCVFLEVYLNMSAKVSVRAANRNLTAETHRMIRVSIGREHHFGGYN
jgi:hypothetical protein